VHTLACGHRVKDPGQTHYCSYLRLDQLLTLQPGPDEVRHPEEHLFVVTHQSFELWFTQLRTDLPRVIEALDRDDPGLATQLMKRCTDVVRMFSPMMRVLETMTLGGFYAFRHHLVPASGGESGQWHEIELLSGAREPELRKYLERDPDPKVPSSPLVGMWTPRLGELWDAPSVASAAEALFARRGVSAADAYAASHRGGEHWDLALLAEALLDYDEEVRVWRFVHARTAERTIGPDTEGTAHTSGVRYLERMATHRVSFFPFLWRARGELWERAEAERM
jgi:tryptophan 2,3-dioxygenase